MLSSGASFFLSKPSKPLKTVTISTNFNKIEEETKTNDSSSTTSPSISTTKSDSPRLTEDIPTLSKQNSGGTKIFRLTNIFQSVDETSVAAQENSEMDVTGLDASALMDESNIDDNHDDPDNECDADSKDMDPEEHEENKVNHYGKLGKHFVRKQNLNIGTKSNRTLLSQPIRAIRRASQNAGTAIRRFSQKIFLKNTKPVKPSKPTKDSKPAKPAKLTG